MNRLPKSVLFLNSFSAFLTGAEGLGFSTAGNTKVGQLNEAIAAAGFQLVNLSTAGLYAGHLIPAQPKIRRMGNTLYLQPILRVKRNAIVHLITIWIVLIRLLRRLQKDGKADVLITYNLNFDNAIPVFWARLIFGIPFIFDCEEQIHSVPSLSQRRRRVALIIEKIGVRLAGGLIAVNSLLPMRLGIQNFTICRGLINKHFLEMASPDFFKTAPDVIHLTYSGTLDHERGVVALLDEIKTLEGPFHLHVSGSGPQTQFVKDSVGALNQNGKIEATFHGFMSMEALSDLMAKTHIFLNPQGQEEGSTFNQSSFPSKVFQYLSMLRPVVSAHSADILSMNLPQIFTYNKGQLVSVLNQVRDRIMSGNMTIERASLSPFTTHAFEADVAAVIVKCYETKRG